MKPRPELVLVGVTILWGSTFIVTKDIVRDAPPLLYLVVRFGMAALLFVPLYLRQMRDRRLLVDGAILGVLNSLGMILQVIGQAHTTASKSAFITSLNTPLVPLVALAMYRTRPSPAQLAGVVLATVGLVLLTYPTGGARWNVGDLYTAGCATIYSFTIVQIARRSRGHDAGALTAVQIAAATLTFVVALVVAKLFIATIAPERLPDFAQLEARRFVLSPRLGGELVYMAIVCTVATFALQTWAMARMSATHAAIVFALEPVFGTAIAVGVAGSAEWPNGRGVAGACVIMLAVAASEVPRRRAAAAAR
ncbi:MAG TPA: DMT family transporter [Polyangia bacterium]|nr:DMT family transporter [Polyangia bacterium]